MPASGRPAIAQIRRRSDASPERSSGLAIPSFPWAVARHPVAAVFAGLLAIVVLVLGATAWAVWSAARTPTTSARRPGGRDPRAGRGAGQGTRRRLEGRLDHRLLYEQGRAERVVVLGAGRPGDISTEADTGRAYLLEQGLPATAVAALPVGTTTFESLEAAAAWMRDRDLHTAFLVSDPWHNLRASGGWPRTWGSRDTSRRRGTRPPAPSRRGWPGTFARVRVPLLPCRGDEPLELRGRPRTKRRGPARSEGRARMPRDHPSRAHRADRAPDACLTRRSRRRARARDRRQPSDPLHRSSATETGSCTRRRLRRLKHKTQVFIALRGRPLPGPPPHTLEVRRSPRTAARASDWNEDLTEAIALGHDLGHTPFGHLGEQALTPFLGKPFRHNEEPATCRPPRGTTAPA